MEINGTIRRQQQYKHDRQYCPICHTEAIFVSLSNFLPYECEKGHCFYRPVDYRPLKLQA
jgi:hypothetical protein